MKATTSSQSGSGQLFWLLGTMLAVAAVGLLLLGPVMLRPAHYLFSSTEDGIKNYYTAAWYVAHNSGWLFTGMNYPFGEHVVFTDDQPLLAAALAALRRRGVAVSVVGVFNAAMLLAQLLSVPPLLALLRRCRLPAWYAAVVTLLIVLLAPQLERLLGHYALSYGCVVPLLWYVVVRAQAAAQPGGWYGLFGVVLLFWGALHPYYLPIGALLLAACTGVAWWQRGRGFGRRHGWWALATLVWPLLVFQVTMRLTDPYAADRPPAPYGFFAYSSSVWSVFFPVEAPTRGWWQGLFHTPDPSWEGVAYVGLLGTIVAVLTLLRVGRRLRQRQWARLRWPALPPELRVGLWAATLILLFSMGWPFRWGLEGLLNFMGPLRQFRSIGRFAWIFYYIYSVYAAYAFYQVFRLLRQRRRGGWAAAVLAAGLLLWLSEGLLNLHTKAEHIRQPAKGAGRTLAPAPTDPTHYRNRLARAGRRPDDFQAILPIPFYLLGSEKFSSFTSDLSGYQSMRASLDLGVPIAAAMLSRTALYQAQALGQLLSTPAIDKMLLPRLPDRRPLLLVVAPAARRDSAEASLLARARILYRDSAVWLAELPLRQLENRPAVAAEFARTRPQLLAYPGYWASAPAPGVVHQSFDQPDQAAADRFPLAVRPLLGPEVQRIRRGPFALLADKPLAPGQYEASLWAYLRIPGTNLPSMAWRLVAPTGAPLDSGEVHTNDSKEVLGDWVRMRALIPVPQPGCRLQVRVEGRRVVVDEFELRPADVTIWRRPAPGVLVRNNLPLIPPPPLAVPAGKKP